MVALYLGEHALSLFKIIGIMASPIMAVAAIQILRVNTRLLPKPIRPPWWRIVGLMLCAVFYGGISVGLIINVLNL